MAESAWQIAITGVGMVTPLGLSAAENVRRVLNGETAAVVQPASSELAPGVAAGVAPPFDVVKILRNPKNLKLMSRSVRMGLLAAREAVDQSGYAAGGTPPERVGVYVGSGQTGLEYDEFFKALTLAWEGDREKDFKYLGGMPTRVVDRYFSLRTLANAGVAAISTEFGARGPSNNYVQGEIASAVAIEHACQDLLEDRCDVAIVCGYECLLIPSMVVAYRGMGLLSGGGFDAAYRPFQSGRPGMVLGEGAGAMVLERKARAAGRGALIVGQIEGVGLAAQTADVSGLGALPEDIEAAVVQSGGPGDAGYVVARGLGDEEEDLAEARGLERCLSGAVPVTALKGHTTYLGAATAVVELGIGLLCARSGQVPAVYGLSDPDPRVPLNLVCGATRLLPDRESPGLFLSSTFGGHVAAISAHAVGAGEPVHG